MKNLTIPLLLLLTGCETFQPLRVWYKPNATIEEYNAVEHICLKESLSSEINFERAKHPYADAYLEQSKQPAINKNQRASNAMMAGFAAGLNSSIPDPSDKLFKACMYAHGFSTQRKSDIANAQK